MAFLSLFEPRKIGYYEGAKGKWEVRHRALWGGDKEKPEDIEIDKRKKKKEINKNKISDKESKFLFHLKFPTLPPYLKI